MQTTLPPRLAKRGDVIAITGRRVGDAERLGEILEVLGLPEDVHFRVRWDDDRETIFYPGGNATIRRGDHDTTKA